MSDILERLAHCIAGTVTPEDRDAITLEACAEIARLRLTDAERAAVERAVKDYEDSAAWFYERSMHAQAAKGMKQALALRGLLERMK